MKRILIAFLFVFLFGFIEGCSKDDENPVSGGERIGAVCNDGTTSSATGSGACSHHGGVNHWIYR